MSREKIVVLDFGSQYAHLIAKRFRMLGFYSEIALPSAPLSDFENVRGIVFSGGPSSVYDEKIPEFNQDILSLNIPILGLCYGHYIVNLGYNGKVEKAPVGEFGFAELKLNPQVTCPLFAGISPVQQVWMSHQDAVTVPGDGFETVGSTADCPYAALQNLDKKRFSLQFHCEVKDTPCGNTIFKNFAEYCGMKQNWDQNTVLQLILESIKKDAADKNVLLFLSGGVDSTVAFALLNQALGQDRVLGLHIDNGFMRKNESSTIVARYREFGFHNFIVEDASNSFLKAVYHETDPQKKRKAVGENFIAVRNDVVSRMNLDENAWLLAQGTQYPDIIESGGSKNAHTIKTHHNRVEGIQTLIERGLIIEPLKDLYKDEVRLIGKKLGLSDDLIMRHPFPGPGLSINVLCSTGKTTPADEQEMKAAETAVTTLVQQDRTFRSLVSVEGTALPEPGILPVKSVGVQGDFRTYRYPAVLTFPGSLKELPGWDTLEKCSSYITNTIKDVNRTVICLFRKPDTELTLQEGYCDRSRLDQTREADAVVLAELKRNNWYRIIFQHLTINLPYASAPDHCSIVLRPVVSEDVMTARFAHLDIQLLQRIVQQLCCFPFIDALYYDITNKPPATFGWE